VPFVYPITPTTSVETMLTDRSMISRIDRMLMPRRTRAGATGVVTSLAGGATGDASDTAAP
jgi:hypothetical protein